MKNRPLVPSRGDHCSDMRSAPPFPSLFYSTNFADIVSLLVHQRRSHGDTCAAIHSHIGLDRLTAHRKAPQPARRGESGRQTCQPDSAQCLGAVVPPHWSRVVHIRSPCLGAAVCSVPEATGCRHCMCRISGAGPSYLLGRARQSRCRTWRWQSRSSRSSESRRR